MRPELTNIEQIENYLLNRLSEGEKIEFEKRMVEDINFANEVNRQRILINRIKVFAIRKAIKSGYVRFKMNSGSAKLRNGLYLSGFLLAILVVVVLLVVKKTNSTIVDIPQVKKGKPFINPPIPSADVPYIHYSVDASKGGVLTYPGGTKIFIPPNAFLDNSGNPVTTSVQVAYREFNDPIDFFLAGIPMDVVVDDKTYTMESAAMCEINASLNGSSLKINPAQKISIFQSSYTTSNVFDMYYLDTINKNWIKKNKDIPLKTDEFTLNGTQSNLDESFIEKRIEPIKPRMANPDRYSFFVTLDFKEFPEMEGFRDIIFEVDENEKRYNPADGDIEWEDIHLQKGNKNGTYQVTFMSNARKRSVQYIVYPVFEGVGYEQAMKLYNQKFSEYSQVRNTRYKKANQERLAIKKQKKITDSINLEIEKRTSPILSLKPVKSAKSDTSARDYYNLNISPHRTEVLNAELNYKRAELIQYNVLTPSQIDALINVNREELYKIKDNINKLYAANAAYIKLKSKVDELIASELLPDDIKTRYSKLSKAELFKIQDEITKRYTNIIFAQFSNNRVRNHIVREFQIDGFGYWNCDKLIVQNPLNKKIKAEFYDSYAEMNVTEIVFVDRELNSLTRLNRFMFPNFSYDPQHKNIVWAISADNRIVYFNDFKNIPAVPKYIFNLKTIEAKKDQYHTWAEFRGALKKLME